MSFVDNGDGTATIGGTPTAGSAGNYSITITATNGITPDATQNFDLTVAGRPHSHPDPDANGDPTPSPTATPTPTVTPTPSPTATPTPTGTPTPSPTAPPEQELQPQVPPRHPRQQELQPQRQFPRQLRPLILLQHPLQHRRRTPSRLDCSTFRPGCSPGLAIMSRSADSSSRATVRKPSLIRGLGPLLGCVSLESLQDPTLELHQESSVIASNDNWQDTSNVAQISQRV